MSLTLSMPLSLHKVTIIKLHAASAPESVTPITHRLRAQVSKPDGGLKRAVGQRRCCLPHEVSQIARSDIALARAIEPLEGGVRLEGLCLAEVLATKLGLLLGLARERK